MSHYAAPAFHNFSSQLNQYLLQEQQAKEQREAELNKLRLQHQLNLREKAVGESEQFAEPGAYVQAIQEGRDVSGFGRMVKPPERFTPTYREIPTGVPGEVQGSYLEPTIPGVEANVVNVGDPYMKAEEKEKTFTPRPYARRLESGKFQEGFYWPMREGEAPQWNPTSDIFDSAEALRASRSAVTREEDQERKDWEDLRKIQKDAASVASAELKRMYQINVPPEIFGDEEVMLKNIPPEYQQTFSDIYKKAVKQGISLHPRLSKQTQKTKKKRGG